MSTVAKNTVSYMCPCCGAPLAFDGASGKLQCSACGNSYETEVMETMTLQGESGKILFDLPDEGFDAAEAEQMNAFICESCGAELMTDGTTTATECPYCGSPTILPERIEGGVKPEKVVPFKVTKEEAQKQFEEYFKGKALMPNIFLNSRNRISEIRKLYVPYWLFDCGARADIVYGAEKKHTRREGDWEVTTTEHYLVRRKGSMMFENIPVDGSAKLDNKITESIEPYDLTEAVAFQPAVLAGAVADHADVDAEACKDRAVERVETSIADTMRNTVNGYDHVSERGRNIATNGGKVTPVLMPVWLITTEKEGKTYTFAINGQTGKLTCDVPADGKKSFLWGAGAFAASMLVMVLLMLLMEILESGTILAAAVISLIIALVVLGVLKGQLKQAVHQSAAANYVVQDSFDLEIRYDQFLRTTTTRRKIEKNDEKN